jgi:L-aminopeptidase/D-esterase-like protein
VAGRLGRAGGGAGEGFGPVAVGSVDGEASDAFGNTTIGLIVTNARLSKLDCHLVAQSGHDAFARALVPAHTRVDGDAIVAAATGAHAGEAPVDLVRLLAVAAMEQAIRSVA